MKKIAKVVLAVAAAGFVIDLMVAFALVVYYTLTSYAIIS